MANIQVTYPAGSTVTIIEQGSANDPAVLIAALTDERDAAVTAREAAIVERDAAVADAAAKDLALTAMTADRDALATKIATAKAEADQVIAEAQDARDKLN